MRIAPAILLGVVTIFFDVRAENLSFDFKDPRGVSNIAFSLDAPLESINGTAKGIAGTVLVDPDDLSTAEGKIVVATKSLVVPNPIMRMHLLSKDWLNARSNPEISFEIKKVGRVTKKGTHASEAEVTGTFTLNRVTKKSSRRLRSSTCPANWERPPTTKFKAIFWSFVRISRSVAATLVSGHGSFSTRSPMKSRFPLTSLVPRPEERKGEDKRRTKALAAPKARLDS